MTGRLIEARAAMMDDRGREPATIVKAAATYVALVFATGFLLGTLRVLLLAPMIGATQAVVIELPLMLAVSWIACGGVLRRFPVAPTPPARIGMGLIAFLLLMMAEVAVSMVGFGRSFADHLANYRETGARLGLAAQIAFALIPLLRLAVGLKRGTRSPSE